MSNCPKGKSTEFGCWSLSDIIEGRYFRVPDYQRGYAWGHRQLEEFWDDLCVVLRSGGKHYTGAITVKAMPSGSPAIQSREGFEVVDGQQRLTTLAILLSAFSQDGNPLVLQNEGFVFGYGQNNIDEPFFRAVLLGGELNNPENSHQRNLKNAVEFFRAKATDVDTSDVVDIVMNELMFDFRMIGSEYSEGLVFETMNNRGKPLTLLEKLKNRLMYLTETLPADDADKAKLRKEINEKWGEIYRLLASNPQRDPLDEDEFVAAHLSVYRAPKESVYSKSVAESRLFKPNCGS